MKITSLELVPASKYLFIKLHTDEGITGIGEVGAWGYIDGTIGVLKKLEGYIIGQDPMRIEHHWQYMYRSMYFRGSIVMSAISAIDIALWDIKGKAYGVPVYELLGGKCRDKVRTYPAVFKYTPEEMAAGCIEAKKQGFTAARLMITGEIGAKYAPYEDGIYNHRVTSQIERVKACREAVGDDFDLILEVHRSMNPWTPLPLPGALRPTAPCSWRIPFPPTATPSWPRLPPRPPFPLPPASGSSTFRNLRT